MQASEIIEKLGLIPLPEEGGFYKETYRSSGLIPDNALPDHEGDRRFSTQIYYLVTPEEFSGLHRVKGSDEVFHFYLGDAVEMLQITECGKKKKVILGQNIPEQSLQEAVPKGVWQGTKLLEGGQWALLGCSVSPGFEFADFEVKSRSEFLELFPHHEKDIYEYTRP